MLVISLPTPNHCNPSLNCSNLPRVLRITLSKAIDWTMGTLSSNVILAQGLVIPESMSNSKFSVAISSKTFGVLADKFCGKYEIILHKCNIKFSHI